MKSLFVLLMISLGVNGFSQSQKTAASTRHKAVNASRNQRQGVQITPADTQPRQTITERYLNGPQRDTSRNAEGNQANKSPFVSGIYAANSATQTFDTSRNLTNPNAVNVTDPTLADINNNNTTNLPVAGRNDTTFNAHTITNGQLTTTSGAVDRSGQVQFGQTNWGKSRSTVGESQWTVPPPVTSSFNAEFPQANGTTWTRNNDTTVYSARYRFGTSWVITNYNAAGQRLDMRTEMPVVKTPLPVRDYIAKQPGTFRVITLSRLQVPGKPDVYELRTNTGKVIYLNDEGAEVNY